MSALKVLTVEVFFVVLANAMDLNGAANSAWAVRQKAGATALQQNDYTSAIDLFAAALDSAANCDEKANAFSSYGTALTLAGRNKEARSAFEQALSEFSNTSDPERVTTLSRLSAVNRTLGDYNAAEAALRSAIADPLTGNAERADILISLADLLREQGLDSDAAVVLNDAARFDHLPGELHTRLIIERAELARDMHHWDESLSLWNELQAMADSTHWLRLEEVVANGLGETWLARGNSARAEPLLRRALQLVRSDATSTPVQIASVLATIARLYLRTGKLALAEDALNEAIARDEPALGSEHPRIAMLLELNGQIRSRRGEFDAARRDLARAKAIMSSVFGSESLVVAAVHAELGELNTLAHQPVAAAAEYGAAMDMMRKAGQEHPGFAADLVEHYAAALKATHRPEQARALLKSQRESLRSIPAATTTFRTE